MSGAEFPPVIDGRHRITVAQWDARPDALVDRSAYLYLAEMASFGLDPWRVIDGVDARVDGRSFDLWLASGASRDDVPGDFPIYVSARDFALLDPLAAHPIPTRRRGQMASLWVRANVLHSDIAILLEAVKREGNPDETAARVALESAFNSLEQAASTLSKAIE